MRALHFRVHNVEKATDYGLTCFARLFGQGQALFTGRVLDQETDAVEFKAVSKSFTRVLKPGGNGGKTTFRNALGKKGPLHLDFEFMGLGSSSTEEGRAELNDEAHQLMRAIWYIGERCGSINLKSITKLEAIVKKYVEMGIGASDQLLHGGSW